MSMANVRFKDIAFSRSIEPRPSQAMRETPTLCSPQCRLANSSPVQNSGEMCSCSLAGRESRQRVSGSEIPNAPLRNEMFASKPHSISPVPKSEPPLN